MFSKQNLKVACVLFAVVAFLIPGCSSEMPLLHDALSFGHEERFEFLVLVVGLDIYVRDSWDDTLLHAACKKELVKSAMFLIEMGIDVNATNKKHETAMHVLTSKSSNPMLKGDKRKLFILEYLIEAGARIESRDEKGNTALHNAVRNCPADVIEFLLSKGAKKDIRNNEGKTPKDIAMRSRELRIAMIFSPEKR